MPAAGIASVKLLSITLLTSGENHIINSPAMIAKTSPLRVDDEDDVEVEATDCLTLKASALQTIEITMRTRPAAIVANGFPFGAWT